MYIEPLNPVNEMKMVCSYYMSKNDSTGNVNVEFV